MADGAVEVTDVATNATRVVWVVHHGQQLDCADDVYDGPAADHHAYLTRCALPAANAGLVAVHSDSGLDPWVAEVSAAGPDERSWRDATSADYVTAFELREMPTGRGVITTYDADGAVTGRYVMPAEVAADWSS